MEFNFAGKKVLVTGAGKGIGRAIAITLAKSGCKVYALSRTKSALDTLIEEFPDIVPINQDLNDWDATRAILEKIEPLDGLVNNAASAPYAVPALDFTKDQLEFYLQNNLLSVINCTQVVAKKMIESKINGSIVNVSSLLGAAAFPCGLGYGVAKAGVDMVTKQFALELGPQNIRVNSVRPSLVMTDLIQQVVEMTGMPLIDIYQERTPMKRLPSIPEIVSPILYLLSDCSAMVTGTAHVIDAGLSCNITTKQ